MSTRRENLIAHKVRRYQQDGAGETGPKDEKTCAEIPQSVTIEAAIRFFDENAKGEYATLYSRTAAWLRPLAKPEAAKSPAAGNDAVRAFLEARADARFDKEAEWNDEKE